MKDENDPVTPDEYVLRRIPNVEDYVRHDLNPPVQRVAFGPNERDVDGLSVFREACTTPEEVAKAGRNPKGYYVVRISVQELAACGLTVIAAPDPDQPHGHALIPEMKKSLYRGGNKRRIKDLQAHLVKLTADSIVLTPDAEQ